MKALSASENSFISLKSHQVSGSVARASPVVPANSALGHCPNFIVEDVQPILLTLTTAILNLI